MRPLWGRGVLNSADVIVIGGGIVGSSIAYHLAEAGCRDVLVVERETHQGKGSTGKSMGGVRAQFATPINIRMSLYSIAFFGRFDEVMGHPSGYRPQGYLFVATTPAHMDYLRENYRRQVETGLAAARLLDARDVSQIAPELRQDDILGGSFCATDGFVDPHSGMSGFISGRTVVNAAGPWAGKVARLAGVPLPVEPLRRMLVPTEPFDQVSDRSPMVVDMNTGFHYRPEGRGLLLA